MLFGLILAGVSSVIGVFAGAVQGYFGGWLDLTMQRVIEIWSSLPHLYILIILSAILAPSFFVLLTILLLFSWVSLVHVVRAEFLRARNFEYVNAARALGLSNAKIIVKHVLPNAMVATLTFLPFIVNSSISTLTSLDFLGLGMPPGSPSLGELLLQGKSNLSAPWIGLSAFAVIALMLSLLIFIGEAVRDAFDPRKTFLVSDAAPLVEVRDLSIAFAQGGERKIVVDRVSFKLEKGRALALVGESGSGKTVTAQAIVRLLPQPAASYPTGEILFRGRDVLKMSDGELREMRGAARDDGLSGADDLAEPPAPDRAADRRDHRAPSGSRRGDEGAHRRTPRGGRHRRSGRAARRLSASALRRPAPAGDDRHGARQPPGPPHRRRADDRARRHRAGADPEAARRTCRQKIGMAMLFITHDLNVVRRIADDVIVMQQGRNRRSRADGGGLRPSAAPLHARRCSPPSRRASRRRATGARATIASTDNLRVWFPIKRGFFRRTVGHVKAVDGVSLAVREGETVGVVGESGSGKTTLGLAMLRLIRSEGPIAYCGRPIQGLNAKAMRPLRREMQVVFQDPFGSLSPRMSVAEIVEEGLIAQGTKLSAAERRRVAERALADTGLDPSTLDRYPHEFSGGQRQRIAIARAMALDPKFVVLDEPTSALDMSIQAQIVDLLRDLQKRRQLAYLFISHDLKVVRALASEIIVMRRGKVVESGEAKAVFASPQNDYTRALFAAAFSNEATLTSVVSQ